MLVVASQETLTSPDGMVGDRCRCSRARRCLFLISSKQLRTFPNRVAKTRLMADWKSSIHRKPHVTTMGRLLQFIGIGPLLVLGLGRNSARTSFLALLASSLLSHLCFFCRELSLLLRISSGYSTRVPSEIEHKEAKFIKRGQGRIDRTIEKQRRERKQIFVSGGRQHLLRRSSARP